MTITSINLSSLNGSNGFHLEGASRSISNAEDVNGDGFDDVIFGVSDADLNGNNSGSSYVVFGKTSGFDATMDLSDLDGVNGFRLDGVAYDFSGASVSGAGDVNGDGFDDLIVSAPGADPNGSNSGSSYVVFGKAAGFGAAMNLSDLDGGNGFRVDGATGDFLGSLVSGVGDVNGDGFDDVIIGGAGRNEDYSFPVTTDYVMFGKVSGFDPTFNISDLDGSNGFRLDANSYEAATASLSNAGDINGDGYDDVIIGLVFPSPYNETIKGTESYVVFGKAAGFDTAANLSNLDGSSGFRLTGAGFDLYGGALEVSDAGDVNGDGFDDVIIGAPEANWNGYESGSSYVIFGKASGFDATMDLSDLDGDNGFRLDGERYDSSGRSVSGAGDVNGDGFGDLIVGVPGADPNGSNSGSSYVVFGKAAGFGAAMNLSDLDSGNGFRVDGATGDFLGSSVSGAGDVNGDGFDDLIVGAPGVGSSGNDSGSSYIIFGRRNFQGEVVYVGTPEDDNLTGTSADERFEAGDGNDTMSGGGGTDIFDGGNGDDVIRVPDLNFQTLDGGSGIDTLELIGGGIDLNLANFHDRINGIEIIDLTGNGDNTLTLTLADLVPKIEGNDGDHVVIRGGGWLDSGIDGDYHTYTNRNDVVLQINVTVSTNPPTLGGVFSLSSLNGINGFSLYGGEAYNLLGWSVSNAGDVNGDGFDDVITGVPGDNSSYVVFGKASGFDARLDLSTLNGINGFHLDGVAYDFSGGSVSNAGDVNGDGFADMIIGARNADASYVVFGKASSFNARLDLSSLDGSNGFRLDGGAKARIQFRSATPNGDLV